MCVCRVVELCMYVFLLQRGKFRSRDDCTLTCTPIMPLHPLVSLDIEALFINPQPGSLATSSWISIGSAVFTRVLCGEVSLEEADIDTSISHYKADNIRVQSSLLICVMKELFFDCILD